MIKNRPKRESTRRKPTRSFRIQKSKLKWGENSWSFFEPWKSFRFKDRKRLRINWKEIHRPGKGHLLRFCGILHRIEKKKIVTTVPLKRIKKKVQKKNEGDPNPRWIPILSEIKQKMINQRNDLFLRVKENYYEPIVIIILVMHIPRGNSESPSRSPNSHFYNDDEYFKDGRISKGSKGQNFVQQYHDHKSDEKPSER